MQLFSTLLLILLLLLNLLPGNLYAQETKFERISVEQGLAVATVNSILQDQKGLLWFGTQYGLNKYDGYRFTLYKHDASDTASISDLIINAICQDKSGTIWVGTSKGLNRFNSSTNNFTSYYASEQQANALVNNDITVIYEDRAGVLWIGTRNGLSSLDKARKKFTSFKTKENTPNSISSNVILSLYEDANGNFWVGTNLGVSRLDRQTGQFTNFPIFHDAINISSMLVMQGEFLLGSSQGLYLFNTTSGKVRRLKKTTTPINNLLKDREGYLWIGTENTGLLSSNNVHDTLSWKSYQNFASEPYSLGNNVVRTIIEDRSGILWIGTGGGGVSKLDRGREKFRSFRNIPNNLNSLSNNNVFAIYESPGPTVWVGTRGGGLNKFDVKTNTFRAFLTEQQVADPNLPNVWSVYQDRDGELWTGTTGGLGRLSLKNGDVDMATSRWYQSQTDSNSLLNAVIYSFHHDQQGYLWLGTNEGISRLDKSTNTFARFANEKSSTQIAANARITCIAEDKNGYLWFGTRGDGIKRYDRKTNQFVFYQHNAKNRNSLSHNKAFCVYPDKENNIWIGTPEGLNKLSFSADGKPVFTVFTDKDGLPDNVVYSILPDDRGNLWMSTNKGISRFTIRNRQFKNYNVDDGLQSNEFNAYAYHKGKSGYLYFGGVNGFTMFHPDSLYENRFIPPVVLTDFKLANKPVPIRSDSVESPLEADVSQLKEITLSYEEAKSFSFEFAALNYRFSNRNQYAYKMEGFDQDWIATDAGNRVATYTNLPPGRYTFRVKASNNDGVWNEEGISLQVNITPPFWQTWWFRGLVALLIIGSAYTWYRERINRINRQKIILEQQVRERTAEVMKQKEEILLQNTELEQQKEEIETQRDDILAKNTELEQQKEEILAQRDDIEAKNMRLAQANEEISHQKNEVEKLYSNIMILSEIGQKITSILNLEHLISTVYTNVNAMMDASGFGIGIFNGDEQRIEFTGFMENSQPLAFFYHQLADRNRFSVWCFENRKEIVMNDIENEYHHYIQRRSSALQGASALSLVYLPLFAENRIIGVLTVQSFHKNAYSEQDITVLRTLASYIAIAIENVRNYSRLEDAKSQIEKKNIHITDSIRYAETIQHSILPTHELMNQALGEGNHFVFFRPKDIVSGDFYWCKRIDNKVYVAVVDCTGHGVPGAFMSLISNTLLNESVNEISLPDPATVLEILHVSIRKALQQDTQENDDGMDVALCVIEQVRGNHGSMQKKLTFAGAKRSLLHVSEGAIHEIRGDRKSIGGRQKEDRRLFTNQSVEIKVGDMIYLTSDGYIDQNNTEKVRYGTSRLKEVLVQMAGLDMCSQYQTLEDEMTLHQGRAEQRDDITIVGIKL